MAIHDAELARLLVIQGILSQQQIETCQRLQSQLLTHGTSLPLHEIVLQQQYATEAQMQAMVAGYAAESDDGTLDFLEAAERDDTTLDFLEDEPAVQVKQGEALASPLPDTQKLAAPVADLLPVNDQPLPPSRYRMICELGKGGMGKVYKAYDTVLNRPVAIKILSENTNQRQATRFLQEAHILATLNHPNIVQIFDMGEWQDSLFFAMEYVEGETLDRYRNKHELTILQFLQLMETVATATAYLHERHILHRDLKPANIMVEQGGRVKIMDFGLAKLRSSERKLSQEGTFMGTLGYMAPEQYEGDSQLCDERSDVYALGIILYELLTGTLPFRGDSAMQILAQQIDGEATLPSACNQEVTNDLDTICLKAIERDKQDRYPDVATFAHDLRCCIEGEAIWAKPASFFEKICHKFKKNKTAAAAVACCVFLLAVAGWLLYIRPLQNERARAAEMDSWQTTVAQQENMVNHLASTPVDSTQAWQERKQQLDGIIHTLHTIPVEPTLEPRRQKILSAAALLRQEYSKPLRDSLSEMKETVKKQTDWVNSEHLLESVTLLLHHPDQAQEELAGLTLSLRARMHELRHDYNRAKSDYEAAGNRLAFTLWLPARARAALCLFHAGESETAGKWLETLLASGHRLPDQPFIDVKPAAMLAEMEGTLVHIYLRQRKVAKAIETYQKLQKNFQEQGWQQKELIPVQKNLLTFATRLLQARGHLRTRWQLPGEGARWLPKRWFYALEQSDVEDAGQCLSQLKEDSQETSYLTTVCGFYRKFLYPKLRQSSRIGMQNQRWGESFASLMQNSAPKYSGCVHIFLAFLTMGKTATANGHLGSAKRQGFSFVVYPECLPLLDDSNFAKMLQQPEFRSMLEAH
jgi:serine/threonine protein kinase